MATIQQLHLQVQDKIQDKLQNSHVPEPIQDKLGEFALSVISEDYPSAAKVLRNIFSLSHNILF